MTGREERDNKFKNRINSLAKQDIELQKYMYFISNMTERSKQTYVYTIRQFLNQLRKDISEVDVIDLTMYISELTSNGKPASKSYMMTTYSALRSYFTYLYNTSQIATNPMEKVPRPKQNQNTEERQDFLTKDEIAILINRVKNGVGSERSIVRQSAYKSRDLAIVMTFLLTGMRCSALAELNYSDINFETKTLTVITKGNKKQVFLAEDLFIYLEPWLEMRKNLGYTGDALFLSNRNQRISSKSVETIIKKYGDNINGKHITPHKLRATYATQVYEATKDIYLVSKCLGHANIETTKIYIRGQNNQTDVASKIMSNIISV